MGVDAPEGRRTGAADDSAYGGGDTLSCTLKPPQNGRQVKSRAFLSSASSPTLQRDRHLCRHAVAFRLHARNRLTPEKNTSF
jgi:hypothetical protein